MSDIDLLEEIEIEKERRLWELGQYSNTELQDELERRLKAIKIDTDDDNLYSRKEDLDCTGPVPFDTKKMMYINERDLNYVD